MCLNPISRTYRFGKYSVVRTFACGKCIECLRHKQSDYAVGAYRTAEHYGNKVEFVTLTYRPASIPVYETAYKVDDGELIKIGSDFVRDRKRLYKSYFTDKLGKIRKKYRSEDWSKSSDCIKSNVGSFISVADRCFSSKISKVSFDEKVLGEQIYCEYCHSLCRKDLRLSLKRGRVQYERKHGKPLPEFKYLATGEYGKLGRPHYHLLVFGLSHIECCELFEDWRKSFGHIYIKSVVPKKKGVSQQDAIQATCRYVSKYMCKGILDDSKVIAGVSEKPRKMASLGFGFWSPTEKEKEYYLGYDIIGPYSLDFKGVDMVEYKDKVLPRITERCKCFIQNNILLHFPKPLKQKIFYVEQTNCKGEKCLRASEVQKMVSAFVQSNSDKDFMQRLRQMERESPNQDVVSLVRIINSGEEISRTQRAERNEKNLLEMYHTCCF